jgi:hypothetical protein
MTWRWRSAYTWISVLLVVAIAPILLYGGFISWDIHRVRHVCTALAPGLPVADIRRVVTRYGLDQFLRDDDGLFDEKTKTWNIFIPAGTTLGDVACAIEHNRKVVVRTKMMGEK